MNGLFNDDNWETIPNKPGLYAYYLNNISLSKMGLFRDVTYTEEELSKTKEWLKVKVKESLEFLRKTEYNGSIFEQSRTRHLRKTLSLHATTKHEYRFLNDIDKIPSKLLPAYIDMLESSGMFYKPIYVGITTEQTLIGRYIQHKDNYENNVEGTFGYRLRENNILWSDISLRCISISQSMAGEKNLIELCEKYIFLVSDPLLSIK